MEILEQVMAHYKQWTDDMTIRKNRKNGYDEVTRAYLNQLPANWPYINKVVDPRIRTVVIEKNARLLNSKLRGRLLHREGGDVVKAQINNAIIDFQWDNAKFGGTMLEKWSDMDKDTRMYASRFARVWWRFDEVSGKVLFDGNEFTPISILDSGIDPSADNIRNARWFQERKFEKVSDLEDMLKGTRKASGLAELLTAYKESKQDRRDNSYHSVALQRKGLEDRVGTDKAFPVIELVTEYRTDKFITFAPRHNIIVSEIDNPYNHKKIPFVQLKYSSITGDPLGESDIESVLPIWKAIQATINGYLDSMVTHNRPPLKIIEGQARIETIVYGPEAKWLVNSVDAVTEMQGSGDALRYFQTAYTSFVSAFNTALGEFSQGTSNIDPLSSNKTATEIKASGNQQNSRDQKDQTAIGECICDMMAMWVVNNQQFLFADPEKKEHVLRILGKSAFELFKQSGLDQMVMTEDVSSAIHDIVQQMGGNLSDDEINNMIETGKTPLHPVPVKGKKGLDMFKPKMEIDELGNEAALTIVPEDLEGTYDYIPSIKSMAIGALQERIDATKSMFENIFSNPLVLQSLGSQGYQMNTKDLITSIFEDSGSSDSERFIIEIPKPPLSPDILGANGQPSTPGGPAQGIPAQGSVQQPQLPGGLAPPPANIGA